MKDPDLKTYVLFGSRERLTNAHVKVTRPNIQNAYFVRTVVVNGNMMDAMTAIKPMDGEVLLNAVPATKLMEALN